MRSVWSFNRPVILVLGATLFCAPLLQTRAGSQNPANGERDRSRVALAHFFQAHATAGDRGVLIEWRTGFEPDILGFNLYRISNGKRTQINPGLINGSALILRQPASLGSYAWYDPSGNLASEYYVESIDLRGQSSVHDPVQPVWSARLPERSQSELLEHPGAGDRAASKQTEWAEASVGSPQQASVQSGVQSVGPETLSDQWTIIANQPALKIGVRADGWYRITQPEMAAAGFATSADARNLRLFVGGNEIAMRTSRDSGALTASDYVEFWGQGLDVATTDTQIYWLVNGAQAGKRIVIAGEVNPNATLAPPVKSPPVPTAAQDAPNFWFGGVSAGISGEREAEDSGQKTGGSEQEAVGRRQSTGGSERVSVPPAVTGGSDSRVGSKQKGVGSEQKTVNSEQLAVSSRLSVPPAVAGGPNTQVGSKQKAASTNSRFQIRKSKLRRDRRKRSRALRRNHATMTVAAAPNFIYNVQRKDRGNSAIFFSAALNGDQENFFGQFLSETNNPSLTMTLRNVETTSAGSAQVSVALQGVSLQNHQVNVLVNGLLAGTISFTIQDAATQTFSFPVSWLVEGDNIVKLVPTACVPSCPPGHDSSVLDYVRIGYPHSFRADNNSLQFNVKSTLAARIDGFTSANIRVLDTSDPANVQAVRPIIETSGAGFALTIQPVGRTKGRRLVALPDTQLSQAASLTLNAPSTLNLSSNGADLVVISYKDFIPSLTAIQPPSGLSFVTLRQSQAAPNYAVKVVDVEDVFDEFSYGVHTPQAIRDFLALATTTWATTPRYVLLVGDASYDPRNYQGFGKFDFVPTKLVDTGVRGDQTALETASDDWLADFHGDPVNNGPDGIADISIGRLPVRTLAEANLVVGKVVNYSPANPPQSALLVADAQGSYYWPFEDSDDQLGLIVQSILSPQKLYRRLFLSPTGSISTSLNGNTVTGTGTLFSTELHTGDTIVRRDTGAKLGTVASITNDASLTLTANASQTYIGAYNYPPSGTITTNSSNNSVSGSGTSFTTEVRVGDLISRRDTGASLGTVASISSDTSMTLTSNASATYVGAVAVDAPTRLRSQLNAGQSLVIYSGHGNTNIWGGSIFSSDDAMSLTNGNKLPFVVVMDCLNGFFTVPQASGQSLAEALVKAPNGGAVASFASSGLTIPDGQHQMGAVMFDLLYGHPTTIPIGDASRQSKASTNDLDVRRTWILFGDPTMKIR